MENFRNSMWASERRTMKSPVALSLERSQTTNLQHTNFAQKHLQKGLKPPGLQNIMKTTWIGTWRLWQHLSCYIGNGFTFHLAHVEKKRKGLKNSRISLRSFSTQTTHESGCHGMARSNWMHANMSYSHTWMARSSVVFFSDMLWQSNFVALLSSIIDRFVLQFFEWLQKGEQTKSKFIVQLYLLVLATCQAFSFSSLDSLD